jgi:prophage DNA circulation protein
VSGFLALPSSISSLGLPSPAIGQSIDNSGVSFGSGTWAGQLVPGSWRGVPFMMDTLQTKAGRRIAIHEYPFTEGKVWPEDIGKLPRHFALQCFLIGDDVYQTRDAMLSACETAGPGTLVIPSMGPVEVVCLDFTVTDRRDMGRMVSVSMAFIQSGASGALGVLSGLLPSSVVSTASSVFTQATNLANAAQSDLSAVMATVNTVLSGRILDPVLAPLAAWGGLAVSAVNDATRVLHAVTGLAGLFGRYASGARGTLLPTNATVASVIADGITSRAAVLSAVAGLAPAAGAGTAQLSDAAQLVAVTLAASVNDPADGIRLLLPLSTWAPPSIPGNGSLSASARTAQAAVASNLRSAALGSLATVATQYAPVSYEDALSTRGLVCDAIGGEIVSSGSDPSRHATCDALIGLRAAVALDLGLRGSNLPSLIEVTNTSPQPSLAVAWQLYQDTTREPGLVAAADPPHPLFMPLSFPALQS